MAENGILAYSLSPLDINGTWNIETVNGAEILVIKPPLMARDEWMIENNSYTIYAVEDGAVRQGEVIYHSENSESYEFIAYNETAIKDIYAAMTAPESDISFDSDTNYAYVDANSSSTGTATTEYL